MPQDWDIKPRADQCTACKETFTDGATYTSALVFGEAGYARADYCEGCWPAVSERAEPYSMWQGVFRVPPPEPEEPLKKETAESLLRKLIEDEDESKAAVRYILAVMLERKKILVERDVQKHEDGALIRVYEHRKSGETFLIPDPHLRLDELEPVQRQVIDMLGGGKSEEPPAQEPEPAPPAADTATQPPPKGFKEGFYSRD
jgi:hypothetical protein